MIKLSDNFYKFSILLESLGFFIIYYLLYLLSPSKMLFIVFTFYFIFRIIFDNILVLISFFKDESIRFWVAGLTKNAIPFELNWKLRVQQTRKVLLLDYLICTCIFFMLQFGMFILYF